MVDMGPKAIRFATMPKASRIAIPAWLRTIYFLALLCFLQAIIAMMAMTKTIPNPIKYGATVVSTFNTSSMLIANMLFSSLLFGFHDEGSRATFMKQNYYIDIHKELSTVISKTVIFEA